MTRMAPVLVVCGCALVSCAAPPSTGLQPADFAYGATLDAPAGVPFVRVTVPERAYGEAAWPDLRDLRVFNAAAEPVPFARTSSSPTMSDTRRVRLRSFRLESVSGAGQPRIELVTRAPGVELPVIPPATSETGVEYLLAMREEDAGVRIDRLHLDWRDRGGNWQQTVTVSISPDLHEWHTVAHRRPILDLRTGDGERLRHDEVVLDRGVRQRGPYWRLRFDAGPAPALTGVEGETGSESVPAAPVAMATVVDLQADGSAVYRLAQPQHIVEIRITPQDPNSVLPVVIEARDEDRDVWTTVRRAVAYRLQQDGNEQFSAPVRIGRRVSRLRIRPIGTSWSARPPAVHVLRDAIVLVVNARGAGPFLLAWGCRAAVDTSVSISTLVPGGDEAAAAAPAAAPGSVRELGGASRLTAIAPAERAARWRRVLVWIALIGGAIALAALAWRLFRQARPSV